VASQDPFPLIVPRSTERRMDHFDEMIYTATKHTVLYQFVDALCGTTGAGSLVNEIFLARANQALDTIYFNELDFIFGRIHFLSRSPAESYPYTPMVDILTAKQWKEVQQKDTWYRERIREFFIACSLGGTPEGIRRCVHAAIGVDCDIYEVWRHKDSLGMGDYLGRSPVSSRSEVVITPHDKKELKPQETRLLRDMLAKIMPVETVVTIDLNGLSRSVPVKVAAATADSTYYEVQKMITPTPVMEQLPPPELLPIDLLSTEQWMYSKDPTLAPYAAFNMTSEYGYHYLTGTSQSPIDTVTYGTLQDDGSVVTESNFTVYQSDEKYTDTMLYELADSPDNFPGGKYGLTPSRAPALNAYGEAYTFAFLSQIDYITQRALEIVGLGGIANSNGYRLPVQQPQQVKREFLPQYAISNNAPARESTVSSSITRRRWRPAIAEARDPAIFASVR
jgi:hypothetical protein